MDRRRIVAGTAAGVLVLGLVASGISQEPRQLAAPDTVTITLDRATAQQLFDQLGAQLTTTSTTTTTPPTTTTLAPTTTTTLPPTTTTTTPPIACMGVAVAAGANLVTIANTHAAGATFCLAAGTYNVTAAIPMQTGDKWVGNLSPNGVRMSILTGGDVVGLELNTGNVSGVTLRNFIIERFNPPNAGGRGSVRAASDWLIENNEIRFNGNVGIFHAARAVIRGNFIHHNTSAGINGYQASDSLIEANRIFDNGSAEVSGVSSGGKWVGGQRVTIRDNHFLNNSNNGLWVDTDIVDYTITGNLVEGTIHSSTDGKGLHIEDSCSVVATGNTVRNNEDNVYLIANRVLDFRDNIIATPSDEAIRVWQEEGGTYTCHQNIVDNDIVDNEIIDGRVRVVEAVAVNGSIFATGDNRLFFDNNTYTDTTFEWAGAVRTFAQWKALGNDVNGTFG